MPVTEARPLRFALVGTGAIARRHVAAFQQHADRIKLVAVCDVRAEAAHEVAESFDNGLAVFEDFDALLDDGSFDAVDICTPHFLHAPQTIASAEAGKHVLVEKPMACSIDESRAMVEAAEAADVTLMVGQSLRYLPGTAGARALIRSGALGEIWSARSDDWFPAMPPAPWMRDAELSGGGVLHMGATHRIDLFRHYFGDVASVRAHAWTGNPELRNGAEDRIVATLEFENGVVAHVTACWAAYTTPHFFQYVILGDSGAIFTPLTEWESARAAMIGQHHQPPIVLSKNDPADGYQPIPPVYEGFVGDDPWINELLHFADCVHTGAEPISSGRDNVGTMKVVYGCYESARSGRDVQLAGL
jgi:predicted dehydrogenase